MPFDSKTSICSSIKKAKRVLSVKRLQNFWQNAAYNRTKHSIVLIYDVSSCSAHPKKPVLCSQHLVSDMSCADSHSLFQLNLGPSGSLGITNPILGGAENRASLLCCSSVPRCNYGAAFLRSDGAAAVTKPIVMNRSHFIFPLLSNSFALLKRVSSVKLGKNNDCLI